MRITRSDVIASESFLRELLALNSPVGLIVVGQSDVHRQAVIDALEKFISTGWDIRWQTIKLCPSVPANKLSLTFTHDVVFRFVNVDGVHSGDLKARQVITQELLRSGAKTIVMLWVDFNLGDPLPSWSNGSAINPEETRAFKWDPSVPECHPAEDEADVFYRLRP